MSDETVETDTQERCQGNGNRHGNGNGNGSSHHHSGSSNGTERRFAAIERDVAVIVSNYSTKEDLVKVELKMLDRFGRLDATLAEMESRMVRWVFAAVVSLAAMAFTAGKLL